MIRFAPLRSSGSFTQHAWATVAAWRGSGLAAIAPIAIAAAGAFSVGCLQTQNLGAEDAGARPDSRPIDETGSSPDAGFDPKLQTSDLDIDKCPGIPPVAGFPCPENFIIKDKSPVQCSYRASFNQRGADGIERPVCGQSCVCAFNGTWSCIDAPCALPSKRACAEGMPCLPGVGCSFGCDGLGHDESSCRACTCGRDQRLSCGKVPTP